MGLAPIVLFVYNRPLHTQKTVEALLKNKLASASDLVIYSDAAKNEKALEKVSEVRSYIKTIQGFKSLKIVEQATNQGLARSIIRGVSEVISTDGKVIVLEDDLVTSPNFLTYMNRSLELYSDNEEVISIHGYNYPVSLTSPEKTFFLKGADCWGWATWKRGWEMFEQDGQKLLDYLVSKNLTADFNFNGSYPYTQMLKAQIAGKNDSWAIRWYASAYIQNKLTLYPAKSLVKNIGLDMSGTHSGEDVHYIADQLSEESFEELEKISTVENTDAKKTIEKFFRKNTKIGFKQRILNFISP